MKKKSGLRLKKKSALRVLASGRTNSSLLSVTISKDARQWIDIESKKEKQSVSGFIQQVIACYRNFDSLEAMLNDEKNTSSLVYSLMMAAAAQELGKQISKPDDLKKLRDEFCRIKYAVKGEKLIAAP